MAANRAYLHEGDGICIRKGCGQATKGMTVRKVNRPFIGAIVHVNVEDCPALRFKAAKALAADLAGDPPLTIDNLRVATKRARELWVGVHRVTRSTRGDWLVRLYTVGGPLHAFGLDGYPTCHETCKRWGMEMSPALSETF